MRVERTNVDMNGSRGDGAYPRARGAHAWPACAVEPERRALPCAFGTSSSAAVVVDDDP